MEELGFMQTEEPVYCSKCGWKGGSFDCPFQGMRYNGTLVTTEDPDPAPVYMPTRVCPSCGTSVIYGDIEDSE